MSLSPIPAAWAPTPAAAATAPAPGEVELWRVDLRSGDPAADRAVLSAAERERAERFLDPDGGRRYVRARACLRRLLGQCRAADPASLVLAEGPHGKPFLQGEAGPGGWQFNVSHSGETALIALAVGHAVGVDLEAGGRKIAASEIAGRWFTAEERAAWLAEDRAAAAFLRIWTRKEALLKAHGGGLAAGMTGFSVAVPLPGARALWPPAVQWAGEAYALLDLDPGHGAVGALAVAGARTLRGLKLRALI